MPAIDGIESLIREIIDLRSEVERLRNQSGRSISLGTSYRIQVVGTGAGAILQAVRIADGNTVQLAP